MSNASPILPRPNSPLRRDLQTITVGIGSRAQRIVIDEIGGRFCRLSDKAWRQLCLGEHDASLQNQARAADLTRERIETPENRISLLAIRLPLGTIDPLASRLAGYSGILFSPIAVLLWIAVMLAAIVVVASRGVELVAAFRLLPSYLREANPILLAVTFLLSKSIHELSHAVMCRRMGARSKSVGVFLFCGMPYPYCDVTDIWRLPSSLQRSVVMLAGIYVELIVAALAAFIWCFAQDPAIRLFAMNLMLVCGISTVLFNSNPLMRYDGYFVLMDLLGSSNLRREARGSFLSVVVSPLAGSGYDALKQINARQIGLSLYHAASVVYRMMILMVIAMFLISLADTIHLRPLGVGIFFLAAVSIMAQQIRCWFGLLQGKGRWLNVPPLRRLILATGLLIGLVALLAVPLPRYRRIDGWVDATESIAVYLPTGGQIQSVHAELGDKVSEHHLLATLSSDTEVIETTRLQGELRLASLRREQSQVQSLNHPEIAQQWATLAAAEQSVSTLLENAHARLDRCRVLSPTSGIIVPAVARSIASDSVASSWLVQSTGTVFDSRQPWCRICVAGKRAAVFTVDGRDHDLLKPGTNVRIQLAGQNRPISTVIESVSTIERTDQLVLQESAYQILCPLPPVADHEVLQSLGIDCTLLVRLPAKTITTDILNFLSELVSG